MSENAFSYVEVDQNPIVTMPIRDVELHIIYNLVYHAMTEAICPHMAEIIFKRKDFQK